MSHEWWHWGEDDWDTFRYDGPPDIQIPSQDYNIPKTDWGSQESISFGDRDDYVYQTPSQQYDPSSFLDYPGGYGSEDVGEIDASPDVFRGDPLGGTESDLDTGDIASFYPEEEQSYADMARETLAKYMPFVKNAQQIHAFATKMLSKSSQQQRGGGGGGGRQIKAPYTTHRAGTEGRTQADIKSTFKRRDSKQLMAQLTQQSERAASGVQIAANRAAQVGKPISGNDLYDLIAKEGQPRGVKQKLPGTGWGLTLTSRQRA